MKKIGLLLLMVIIGCSLTGCIYTDFSKRDMELIDVKVYDSENNEIIGTYKNYYSEIYDYTNVSYNEDIIPLNSAAPVENYYVIDAEEGKSYVVKFGFYSRNNCDLTKIIFGVNSKATNPYEEKVECIDIKNYGDNYEVTLTIEKVEMANRLYETIAWNDGKTEHRFGTMGSNTYIKGVYFNLPSSEELAC